MQSGNSWTKNNNAVEHSQTTVGRRTTGKRVVEQQSDNRHQSDNSWTTDNRQYISRTAVRQQTTVRQQLNRQQAIE